MDNDLELLKEQLSRLGEPELPPSLTSGALFARLDEGTLTLPEEEPLPEKPKTIAWGKIARQWAPLAACLAVVFLLYRGYEVGLARNFQNTPVPQSAAFDAPCLPEAAAFLPDEEAADGSSPEEETPVLRSRRDTPTDAAGDPLQKSVLEAPVSSAPPAPEPSPPPPAGSPDTGSDGDVSSGSDSSGESSRPNPPTGGSNNPDTGPALEPSRPPDFSQDSGENGPLLYKLIKAQTEEIAARHTPEEGLSFQTLNLHTSADDRLVFDAVYTDETQAAHVKITFYCLYFEGKGEAWLEMEHYQVTDL